MDKNYSDNLTSNAVKQLNDHSKTISPAVLGMSTSHGVKLSMNMTSKDKQELLTKLEEWRKNRREKLAASILSKQKQKEKPKPTGPAALTLKNKQVVSNQENVEKSQEKDSVFDRLYKNSGRFSTFKKPDNKENIPLKSSQIFGKVFKKPSPVSSGKPLKPQITQYEKKTLVKSPKQTEGSSQINVAPVIKEAEKSNNQNSENTIEVEAKTQEFVEKINLNEIITHELETTAEIKKTKAQDQQNMEVEESKIMEKEFSNYGIEESKILFTEVKESHVTLSDVEEPNIQVSEVEQTIIQDQQNVTGIEELKEQLTQVEETNRLDQRIVIPETQITQEVLKEMASKSFEEELPEFLEKNKIADAKVEDIVQEGQEITAEKLEEKSIKKKEEETLQPKQVISALSVKMKNNSDLGGVKKRVLLKKPEVRKSCLPTLSASKGMPSKPPAKESELPKPKPIRRSISMLYRNKNKLESGIHKTVSEKDLLNLKQKIEEEIIMPSKNETGKSQTGKSVSFVTPKYNYKLITPFHLRSELEEWLKVHGHPLEGYRHLRCFDVAPNTKTSLKTPINSHNTFNTSMETPLFSTAPNTPVDDSDKENMTPPTVVQQTKISDVGNWLEELHRLIVEVKYPPEKCEEWLNAIRRGCPTCTQLPIYWECLATLDETKGEMKSAIENYERAIIKGAEVDSIGESLAQLFDKMIIEQQKPSKAKLEKGLDPKNIFKSTIIKFALQQKAVKELGPKIDAEAKQQLYIATPVRRSSRIQTPHNSHVVNSLKSLTPEVRNNMKFKPNESLFTEK